MHILLIGNYPHDGQESMQRFAMLLRNGLWEVGISVELLVPQPYFGRLKKSGTGLGKWLGYLDKFLIFPIQLRKKLSTLNSQLSTPPIVHICDHSNAFYTRHLQDVPHLVTCHDLLAVRSARGEIAENLTRWSGRRLQALIVAGLRQARHIVCVSEATQQDVRNLLTPEPGQVSVIPNGLNYPYSPMPEPEAAARVTALLAAEKPGSILHPRSSVLHPTPPPYLLHVGGNQWYKNRLGVLRIYARVVAANPTAPDLIMAGKPFPAEMEAFIAAHDLAARVRCIEGCSNEDLRALYSMAEALLFPSLAEGFGWPIIEAQACGCPVLCSAMEPFPEVTSGSASLHDPADEAGFATAVLDVLTRPDTRRQLTSLGLVNARRFTPVAMIGGYLECYRQLAPR